MLILFSFLSFSSVVFASESAVVVQPSVSTAMETTIKTILDEKRRVEFLGVTEKGELCEVSLAQIDSSIFWIFLEPYGQGNRVNRFTALEPLIVEKAELLKFELKQFDIGNAKRVTLAFKLEGASMELTITRGTDGFSFNSGHLSTPTGICNLKKEIDISELEYIPSSYSLLK